MRGDWIETFTGKKFHVMDPRPDEVDVRDIAHSLSMQCRYFGHVTRFYSVAEHSILLAKAVLREISTSSSPSFEPLRRTRTRIAKTALLHDASEAYTGDMARPLKNNMPAYMAVEAKIWGAIVEALGLIDPVPSIIKEFDSRIIADERAQGMAKSQNAWATDSLEPLGVELQFLDPRAAEDAMTRELSDVGFALR